MTTEKRGPPTLYLPRFPKFEENNDHQNKFKVFKIWNTKPGSETAITSRKLKPEAHSKTDPRRVIDDSLHFIADDRASQEIFQDNKCSIKPLCNPTDPLDDFNLFWNPHELLDATKALAAYDVKELYKKNPYTVKNTMNLIFLIVKYKPLLKDLLEVGEYFQRFPEDKKDENIVIVALFDILCRGNEITLENEMDVSLRMEYKNIGLKVVYMQLEKDKDDYFEQVRDRLDDVGASSVHELLPTNIPIQINIAFPMIFDVWINRSEFDVWPEKLLKEAGFKRASTRMTSGLTYNEIVDLPYFFELGVSNYSEFASTSYYQDHVFIPTDRNHCLAMAQVVKQLCKGGIRKGTVIQTHILSLGATAYFAFLLSVTFPSTMKLKVFGADKMKTSFESYFDLLNLKNVKVFSERFYIVNCRKKDIASTTCVLINPETIFNPNLNLINETMNRGYDIVYLQSAYELYSENNVHHYSFINQYNYDLKAMAKCNVKRALSIPKVNFVVYQSFNTKETPDNNLALDVVNFERECSHTSILTVNEKMSPSKAEFANYKYCKMLNLYFQQGNTPDNIVSPEIWGSKPPFISTIFRVDPYIFGTDTEVEINNKYNVFRKRSSVKSMKTKSKTLLQAQESPDFKKMVLSGVMLENEQVSVRSEKEESVLKNKLKKTENKNTKKISDYMKETLLMAQHSPVNMKEITNLNTKHSPVSIEEIKNSNNKERNIPKNCLKINKSKTDTRNEFKVEKESSTIIRSKSKPNKRHVKKLSLKKGSSITPSNNADVTEMSPSQKKFVEQRLKFLKKKSVKEDMHSVASQRTSIKGNSSIKNTGRLSLKYDIKQRKTLNMLEKRYEKEINQSIQKHFFHSKKRSDIDEGSESGYNRPSSSISMRTYEKTARKLSALNLIKLLKKQTLKKEGQKKRRKKDGLTRTAKSSTLPMSAESGNDEKYPFSKRIDVVLEHSEGTQTKPLRKSRGFDVGTQADLEIYMSLNKEEERQKDVKYYADFVRNTSTTSGYSLSQHDIEEGEEEFRYSQAKIDKEELESKQELAARASKIISWFRKLESQDPIPPRVASYILKKTNKKSIDINKSEESKDIVEEDTDDMIEEGVEDFPPLVQDYKIEDAQSLLARIKTFEAGERDLEKLISTNLSKFVDHDLLISKMIDNKEPKDKDKPVSEGKKEIEALNEQLLKYKARKLILGDLIDDDFEEEASYNIAYNEKEMDNLLTRLVDNIFENDEKPEIRGTVDAVLLGNADQKEGSIHAQKSKVDEEQIDTMENFCNNITRDEWLKMNDELSSDPKEEKKREEAGESIRETRLDSGDKSVVNTVFKKTPTDGLSPLARELYEIRDVIEFYLHSDMKPLDWRDMKDRRDED